MNETDFIQNEDVSNFVIWLIEHLPRREFRLHFSRSRYVPNLLDANVVGIEEVLSRYVWRTSWKDSGEVVQSDSWTTTRHSLQRLRYKLHEAAETGDSAAMLAACLSVLEWGGVSGAKPFLRRKAANGELVAYLRKVRAALDLDAGGSLDAIDESVIERFDAGLTKSHALFDTTGLPIYDSRVGAAISMLYGMYRAEAGTDAAQASRVLRFPSGGARGMQIRNPNALDPRFPAAPQFYTAGVTHVTWAQSQVKLGWIIQEVLKRTDWFSDGGANLLARCHAFEGALFMIGYDLRCLWDEAPRAVSDSESAAGSSGTGWVPDGHSFNKVFPLYVQYRKELGADGLEYDSLPGAGFRRWLGENGHSRTDNGARARCFPLKQTEFDLFERPLDEIVALHDAIETGDVARIAEFLGDFAIQSDERRNVCLVDVWCVGYLRNKGCDDARSKEILVEAGFAGKLSTAGTLCNVGGNVGRYLRLLDEDKRPTQLFHRYFADKLDDLAGQLNRLM